MKKIFLYIILGIAVSLTACNVVDVEPTTAIDGETAVTDSISVERSLKGCYSGLQSGDYYGLRYLYYQDLYPGDFEFRGTFTTDNEVAARRINPSNTQINATWTAIYSTINRCNIIIAKAVDVPFGSSVNRDRYVAEARFIRALCYFDLLKVFGGVPLHLDATIRLEDLKDLPRSTEAQVYDQIIADLLYAEANLLSNAGIVDAVGFGNRPLRGSSLGAKALLARVYLQRGDNANALLKVNEVIASGRYTLQNPYSNIFNQERTTESIFELDFTVNDQNSLASSSNPLTSGQRFYLNSGIGQLYALFQASASAGDVRFAATTRRENNRNRIVKYFRLGSNDDNVPLLRYAEMFLVRAEALARTGVSTATPDPQVVTDINRIRNRAGLASVSPATNADALTEILAQRRLEFAGEGHRFADLKRYGLAVNLFPLAEAFRVVWPIPLVQIQRNPALIQTTGY